MKLIKKISQHVPIVASIIDNLTSTSSVDGLSANQGRILNMNKVEIETITNENGTAIKFSDGTMICRGNTDLSNITFTSSGALYRATIPTSIDFPQNFVDYPQISVTPVNYGDFYYYMVYGILRSKTAITSITLLRLEATANVNIPLAYIAIGRWKL